jgi:hypothetical protein
VPAPVRLGAALLAALLLLTATGDAYVPAALLLLAAGPQPGLLAVLAVLASRLRWGSSDLDAIGGAQAVLGPAILVGPAAGAASAVLATIAVVLVATRSGERWPDVAAAAGLGVLAATLAAGPQVAGGAGAAVRFGAAVVGVVAAIGVATISAGSTARRRRHAWASGGAALAAVALAALA